MLFLIKIVCAKLLVYTKRAATNEKVMFIYFFIIK